jgi:hypothetical protein
MKNLPRWQQITLIIASLALVAGISFVISSSGREQVTLDTVPEDIVRENQELAEDFGQQSGGRGGGILVSPTEILAEDASVGTTLPVRVENRGKAPADLRFDFVPVYRALSGGAPVVEDSPENLKQGQALVSLSQRQVTLGPGQSTEIRAEVLRRPDNGVLVGSIGTTIKDPNPRSSDPVKNDVQVTIRNDVRINTMAYILWPEVTDRSVSLERVRATEGPNGELNFSVRVRGGQGIASPEGSVTILDASGQRVASADVEANQRIIPGSARDLILSNPVKGLGPGRYQADAVVIAGKTKQEVSWPFEITEDGGLPAPAAKVSLRVNPVLAKPGQEVELRAQIENSGSKNFQPTAEARLFELGQEEVLEQKMLEISPLAPGDSGEATASFVAPNRPGNYELIVEILAEDQTFLDQRVVSFAVPEEPAPEPGIVDRFRDWLSDNPFGAIGIGIAAFGILALIIIGLLAIIGRARKG